MDDNGVVLFALSPGDYENLSVNMADILRWIREAQWQLNYYRDERGKYNGDVGRGTQKGSPVNSAGDSSHSGQGDANINGD